MQAEAEAEEKQRKAAIADGERTALDQRDDAEILTALQLKDPDEMGEGDDFSGFMKAAVPERLRRRALRKLWLSNPVLANVDNLVDYGEDFTDAANAFEKIQTAYQVGRGMLKHVDEIESQKAKSDVVKEVSEEVVAQVDVERPEELTVAKSLDEELEVTTETEIEIPQSPTLQRRLRFEFVD